MPTYLNSGSSVIEKDGVRLEVGDSTKTYKWFAVLPADVTKTSDSPYYDPIIYSAKATAATISVPASATGNYQITVFAEPIATTTATFKINSSSAVDRILGAGETFKVFCSDRIVDSLIFSAVTGNVYVTIEKV